MLAVEMLKTKFAYNTKINNLILEQAAKLTDEQLDAPIENGVHTLRRTLHHILIVEWNWRFRIENGRRAGDDESPAFDDSSSVQEMIDFHERSSTNLHSYLDGMDESRLKTPVYLVDSDGTEYEFVSWRLLTHILYHSAQHRGETAMVLTELDHSPGDIDFLFYG